MKRASTVIVAVAAALLISMFASGGPITPSGGLSRVYHSGAFFGLGTSTTNLDLRHDCSSGSGLAWSGSTWDCAAMGGSGGSGGSGFTIAGAGLLGSGATINITATAGGMIAIGSDSVGLDGSGCGSSVGWLPTWNGSAFACAAPPSGSGGGGGGGSASVAITVNAFPGSTTNLSTVGTIDWFWWGNTGDPATIPNYSTANTAIIHWKKGGLLWQSVQWFGHSLISGQGAFPGSTTFTTTAADDAWGTALSATDGTYGQITTAGFGFQVNIPASTTSRTLRIYTGAKGVTTTIAASLDDAAGTGSSTTYNAASGVNEIRAVDIVFAAGTSARLRVIISATTLNGGVQAEELWGMAEF